MAGRNAGRSPARRLRRVEITVVADREADIYEEFALRPPETHLVIRAMQDRRLACGGTLFACAESLPELGRLSVDLPAAPGRLARTAILVLRACPVVIPRPERRLAEAARLPETVAVWLVDAREVDPPEGSAPAHWRLLTTHAAPDRAAAARLVGFYRQRWTIEQLFRTMKTQGFDIERSRIEHPVAFENLATATLIAAVQVLQLVRERDGAVGPAAAGPLRRRRRPRPGQDQRQPGRKDGQAEKPSSAWLARLRLLDLRPPRRLDRLLRKARPVVMLNGLLRLKTMLQAWALRDV